MSRMPFRPWNAILTLGFLLAACTGGSGTAPKAIEAYLKSLIAGDEVWAVNLSCASWEVQAQSEAASLESVKASLVDLECEEVGASGEATLVSCTGSIQAVYDSEQQEIGLAGRKYRAVEEAGEWKMCGYE